LDAIELLQRDHRKVEDLFHQYEQAGERAHKTKRELVEQISSELEVHTALEEEIFYPAAEAAASKDDKQQVREGYEEHHVVKVLLGELAGMRPEQAAERIRPEDTEYDPKVTVLMENVRHHIEEEESELLPKASETLGQARLRDLGEQMAKRKEQLEAG
jgi:hemerythrin-like domain-containing protein